MKYGMTSPICLQKTWFPYKLILRFPNVNLALMYEIYTLKFLKSVQKGIHMLRAKIKTID